MASPPFVAPGLFPLLSKDRNSFKKQKRKHRKIIFLYIYKIPAENGRIKLLVLVCGTGLPDGSDGYLGIADTSGSRMPPPSIFGPLYRTQSKEQPIPALGDGIS